MAMITRGITQIQSKIALVKCNSKFSAANRAHRAPGQILKKPSNYQIQNLFTNSDSIHKQNKETLGFISKIKVGYYS